MFSNRSLFGTPRTIGKVASTIGTAPRSPAQDRNACSRNGIRKATQGRGHRQRPRSEKQDQSDNECGQDSSRGSWCGMTSSPSSMNNPIWASQPSPSAKDRVAARCGSPALARISAAR